MVDAVPLTKRTVLIQRGIIRLALTNAQIKYFRTGGCDLDDGDHHRVAIRRDASSRAIDRVTSPIIPR